MRKLIVLFLLPILLMSGIQTLTLTRIDSTNSSNPYRRYWDTLTWTKSADDTLLILLAPDSSNFKIAAYDKAVLEGWGNCDSVSVYYQTALRSTEMDSITSWDSLTTTLNAPTQPNFQQTITLPLGIFIRFMFITHSNADELIKVGLGLFDDDK